MIDRFNSAMGFLDNAAAKILLFVLSVTSIINAIMLIPLQQRCEPVQDTP